ncbi:MAG: hypothetical protein M0R46_16210 [Candidatus Muirbacterium halophilum]|nr:hypothetical protein [Candidatus Muirbacterium halophilum]MCK9477461.1 hypothetical protein [Candidatus Muirbacterium halophilum]
MSLNESTIQLTLLIHDNLFDRLRVTFYSVVRSRQNHLGRLLSYSEKKEILKEVKQFIS